MEADGSRLRGQETQCQPESYHHVPIGNDTRIVGLYGSDHVIQKIFLVLVCTEFACTSKYRLVVENFCYSCAWNLGHFSILGLFIYIFIDEG